MYAVIQTGGKQYRVKEGDTINIEKPLSTKAKKEVVFKEVLLCADKKDVNIGRPFVKGAKVTAEIIGDIKAKKIRTHKYKRRKSYHKTIGHRQQYKQVRIKQIAIGKE